MLKTDCVRCVWPSIHAHAHVEALRASANPVATYMDTNDCSQ